MKGRSHFRLGYGGKRAAELRHRRPRRLLLHVFVVSVGKNSDGEFFVGRLALNAPLKIDNMNLSTTAAEPRCRVPRLNRRSKFIKFLFVDAANFQSQFVAPGFNRTLGCREGLFEFRSLSDLWSVA